MQLQEQGAHAYEAGYGKDGYGCCRFFLDVDLVLGYVVEKCKDL